MGHIAVDAQGVEAVKDVGTVVSAAGTRAAHSGNVDLEGVADMAVGLEKESMELAHQDCCTELEHCCHMAQAGAAAVAHVP